MLVEFLARVLEFDLVWIVGLIFGNLHWLFAIGAVIYFFYGGKKPVLPFILLMGVVWAAIDLSTITGWVWAVPMFLAIHYITRIAIVIFASEIEGLKNKLPVVFVIHFFTIYIIFNLFLR